MALRGMDARSLAARLGVDESAVSLWRSGKRLPRLTHIAAIANALGVEPGVLWSDPDAPAPRRDLAELAAAAQHLSPDQVAALLTVARAMARTPRDGK